MKSDNPDDISLQLRLLIDCHEVINEDFTSTKDLIFKLSSLEESPWGTMQGFNGSFLAKLLRNYGISSQRTSTIRGYRKSDFYDAWNRYISVTPVTPVTLHDASDASDAYSDNNQKTIQNPTQEIQYLEVTK
jgi:hypothetical protein